MMSVNKDTQVNPDDADADTSLKAWTCLVRQQKRTHEDTEETATKPVGEGQPPSKTAPHHRTLYQPRPNLAASRSVAETRRRDANFAMAHALACAALLR
ncbi:hypothetical protein HPB50_004443 [Hyalomma asiaticum]|uniref:Uncharacterized protein n=1 Tax=Hyalomma asiaticum TaxID=266040 RepID=A0ACB7TEJ2_HYAAI|nr:hypothetical protein HPB50_004443 [Hyalomma asiaticum]